MSASADRRRRALPARWSPRGQGFAAALAVVLVLPGACAHAEVAVTAQARADDGGFLAYAPPPAQPAGVCLVDTGVDLNPDTQGEVVERTAIDGGSGDDVSPEKHGTVLAMIASAPPNGWGMVGTAPGAIRIVSVRILEPGKTTFPFVYYTDGIAACLQREQEYNIKVINLSLGSPEIPSSQDYQAIANAVQRANAYGVNVVAAAGNDDSGSLEYPAAYPGVISVAASDTTTGALCSFSNRGEGLRIIAPGCDLDGADPASGTPNYNYWQGTSESSDITAAALGALEAYRPDLSPQAAAQDLTGTQNGTLDIARAFRDAGLGQIVTAGEAAEPATPMTAVASPASTPPSSAPPQSPADSMFLSPLQRPRAVVQRHDGRLILVLLGRPSSVRVQVRLLGRRGRSRRLVVLGTLTGSFTIPESHTAGTTEVSVRYTDPYDITRVSAWTTLKLPKTAGRAKRTRHAK